MKYIVALGDGMPDYPLEELGGKTPLQYARTPHMDRLAADGEVGSVKTIDETMPAGSDVANMAVLGYNPLRFYSGRAPLEAAGMGVDLEPSDVALRCNLVTLSDDEPYEKKVMVDYSSGEISSAEAHELINEVAVKLREDGQAFYPGMSYRHLLVWQGGPVELVLTPPHDITGKEIGPYLPQGKQCEVLLRLMQESSSFLPSHPVNRRRLQNGFRAATSIWLWGQGKKPSLDSFREKYGLEGSVISAVDLVKGLGVCAGLKAVDVPGATGNIETDFKAKAAYGLQELRDGADFVYIHVEAPDEAGHHGDAGLKVQAIEEFDEKVVGELRSGLKEFPEYRLMVLSDHPTPVPVRTHTREPVIYCITPPTGLFPVRMGGVFEETFAASGPLFEQGYTLMDHFILGGKQRGEQIK